MPFALPVWLAPYVLPALAKLAVVAPWLPGWAAVKRYLRACTYAAVLVAGVWAGVKVNAWWQGDVLTVREAKKKADAALAAATLDAREKAVAEKEQALAAREAAVALDEDAINAMKQELDHARGNSEGGGVAVIRGDDEWLRAWMARRR